MGIEHVMARIQTIHSAFAPATPAQPAPGRPEFSPILQRMLGTGPLSTPGGSDAGRRVLSIAAGEVGQAEMPPGSNDSPRIATYRTAARNAMVGPWCAYFVSWAAHQAGTPVGDDGQCFGRVDDIWDWAERTGRTLPAGVAPQPGDLFVLDEHIGIVDRVLPSGAIATIEGNHKDAVTREVRQPTEAVGFVKLG